MVASFGKVAFDVFDRALQEIQPVPHRVELRARDHQFAFAEPQLRTTSTRLVVALPAGLAAVPPRPPRSPAHDEPPTTPHARVFRHSDNIPVWVRGWRDVS